MKRLSIFAIFFTLLFANSGSDSNKNSIENKEKRLITCYKIFKDKQQELELKLERIQEEEQAFQALKDASMNLLKKREEAIKKAQMELNKTMQELEVQKKENEKLIKKYQDILKQIKEATSSKVVQSYSKMRAGNAAQIIENMDINSSLEILSKLSPKVLSKIFAKMDPKKAALLTEKLKSYIPKSEK